MFCHVQILRHPNITSEIVNLHWLVKGLFKTDVFKFSFFSRIVDLWNCLLLDIGTIEHFSSIKNSSNKFYLNKFNVNKDRFL